MEKLFDKLSLYELLSMMIPGSFLLLEIGTRLNLSVGVCSDKVFISPWSYCLFFVFAYLVGLIVDSLAAAIFKHYRNNPIQIKQFMNILDEDLKIFYKCSEFYSFIYCCVVMAIITIYSYYCSYSSFSCTMSISICFASLFVYDCCRLVEKVILNNKEKSTDQQGLHLKSNVCVPLKKRKRILRNYYKRYYYLQSKGKLGIVSSIEGQVAFIRNISFVLIISIILLCFQKGESQNCLLKELIPSLHNNCIYCCYSILLIISVFVMTQRQGKIYYRVCTDYHFLIAVEEEQKINKD